MSKVELIENNEGQRLYYQFTPAMLISNFVPLVVILSDSQQENLHFEYKMWNILSVSMADLHEDNMPLLSELISQSVEEYECEEHVYIYALGDAAYTALYQGLRHEVNAVYLKESRNLDGTSSSLAKICEGKTTLPLVYWCDEKPSFEVLEVFNAQVSQRKFCVNEENEEVYAQKVLNFLEKMISQV